MYNQAFYIEHFQFIPIKFNLTAIPTESTMIRYFKKDLKLSIKAKIDQGATQLNDFKELIAKTIKAKAKADLWPSFYK